MENRDRNGILEGAARLYENGMPLASLRLAQLADGPEGSVVCAACGLGALIISAGTDCHELAENLSDPFYETCRPPYEDGDMTPLQQAVVATAVVISGRRPDDKNVLSIVYGFSDGLADTQPLIDVFRRAKELP